MNLVLADGVTPSQGTSYVFAAYLVFLLIVVIYIAILGLKFQRINKELGELNDEIESKAAVAKVPAEPEKRAETTGERVEATNG